MPSLLLVVFILQFLLHIVNTVGANTVNELVSPRSCSILGGLIY
jgi:hypothetical protein